jgi:hypothetical protein
LVIKEKAVGLESAVVEPAPPNLGLRLPATLALPLVAIAVYLALYISGLWPLGRVQLAPRVFYVGPFPYLAFAAIIGLGLSWYRAARPPAALAGAAVLFVLLSLISIGQSAATQQLIESVPRSALAPAVTAMSLTASVVISASVMLVAGTVAPALREASYWLIALLLWPFASYLIFLPVPFLAATWNLDPPSYLPHLYFAAMLLRQSIIFGCIGYWLDRNNRRSKAITLVF